MEISQNNTRQQRDNHNIVAQSNVCYNAFKNHVSNDDDELKDEYLSVHMESNIAYKGVSNHVSVYSK